MTRGELKRASYVRYSWFQVSARFTKRLSCFYSQRRTFVAHRKKNDATERWRQRDSGMEKKAFRVREIRYKCDSWKVAMGMMSSYELRV